MKAPTQCAVCRHVMSDAGSGHTAYRSHSACSVDRCYSSADCDICRDRWVLAWDTNCPMDTWKAFQSLRAWIDGFPKNSGSRPSGEDYFVDPSEKDDLSEIHMLLHNTLYVDESEVVHTSSIDCDALPSASSISDPGASRSSGIWFIDNVTASTPLLVVPVEM